MDPAPHDHVRKSGKPVIRIAMYLGSEVIQNIAIAPVSRHKSDTSGRSNASTPDARHKQIADD